MAKIFFSLAKNSSKTDANLPVPNYGNSGQVLSGDPFAEDLRGFGITGIIAILLILLGGNLFISDIAFIPLGGLLVLAWKWQSKTPWSELGFIRPHSWIGTLLLGIVLGVGLKLMMKSFLMPLLGAPSINSAYHFLSGNNALLPVAILFMMVAGLSEEMVFRGFLFNRFGKLLGPGFWSKAFTILITATLFGLGHLADQGFAGFEQAAIVGLIYGMIYIKTGKLWILTIAHAAFDITAVAIIYWKLESVVAHFFFK
ncbi:MAG: CPBP family intramembrane glutamic endopeptidase [Flavisolibacter sp.]